jgi:hypothetical protein
MEQILEGGLKYQNFYLRDNHVSVSLVAGKRQVLKTGISPLLPVCRFGTPYLKFHLP